MRNLDQNMPYDVVLGFNLGIRTEYRSCKLLETTKYGFLTSGLYCCDSLVVTEYTYIP